jgi:hypothetical protein
MSKTDSMLNVILSHIERVNETEIYSKGFPDGSLMWQDQQLLLYVINCDMCSMLFIEKAMIDILIYLIPNGAYSLKNISGNNKSSLSECNIEVY